jgi:hypothetical protein
LRSLSIAIQSPASTRHCDQRFASCDQAAVVVSVVVVIRLVLALLPGVLVVEFSE